MRRREGEEEFENKVLETLHVSAAAPLIEVP